MRWSFFRGDEGSEEGVGSDGGRMGDGDGGTGRVVDGEDAEVLMEGAAAPGIDGLETEADAEYGLAVSMGVFEEEDIGGFTGRIGSSAGGVG